MIDIIVIIVELSLDKFLCISIYLEVFSGCVLVTHSKGGQSSHICHRQGRLFPACCLQPGECVTSQFCRIPVGSDLELGEVCDAHPIQIRSPNMWRYWERERERGVYNLLLSSSLCPIILSVTYHPILSYLMIFCSFYYIVCYVTINMQ